MTKEVKRLQSNKDYKVGDRVFHILPKYYLKERGIEAGYEFDFIRFNKPNLRLQVESIELHKKLYNGFETLVDFKVISIVI